VEEDKIINLDDTECSEAGWLYRIELADVGFLCITAATLKTHDESDVLYICICMYVQCEIVPHKEHGFLLL
jgi:hypothetical protein